MDADELIDKIVDLEDYLYDWVNSYEGHYGYVDHTNWTNTCMMLFQKYKFDINKIKEDIKNGTILIYKHEKTSFWKTHEDELYKAHKKKVEQFEKTLI